MKMTTALTTSQINQLISWIRKNDRAARAARFLMQFFDLVGQATQTFIFEVLKTTRTHSSKSFILCVYVKTIRAKQAKVYFAYFVHRNQHGIIAKRQPPFHSLSKHMANVWRPVLVKMTHLICTWNRLIFWLPIVNTIYIYGIIFIYVWLIKLPWLVFVCKVNTFSWAGINFVYVELFLSFFLHKLLIPCVCHACMYD